MFFLLVILVVSILDYCIFVYYKDKQVSVSKSISVYWGEKSVIDGVPCGVFYGNYYDFSPFPLKRNMINCVPGGKRLMALDGDAAWSWVAAAQNKLLCFVDLCEQHAELNLPLWGKENKDNFICSQLFWGRLVKVFTPFWLQPQNLQSDLKWWHILSIVSIAVTI